MVREHIYFQKLSFFKIFFFFFFKLKGSEDRDSEGVWFCDSAWGLLELSHSYVALALAQLFRARCMSRLRLFWSLSLPRISFFSF